MLEKKGKYSCAVSPMPTGDVKIPGTLNGVKVTSIGDYAFHMCEGLTSVTIPSSVTSIGSCAFNRCTSLASVTIPNSVTSIGRGAFAATPFYNDMPDGMVVLGGGLLCGYKGKCPSTVVIPSNVTSIAEGAFAETFRIFRRGEASGLKTVVIASSVTNIGDRAFSYCGDLANVTMLGERPNAPNNIFERCGKLKAIHVPANAKSWAGMKDWHGIPLVFDADVETDGSVNKGQDVEYKFNYNLDAYGNAILSGKTCVSPKPEGALVVPAMIDGHKVTRINGNFRGCDQMTSIMFPASLMTFPMWNVYVDAGGMFDGCSSLKNIGIAKNNPKYASVDGVLYSKDMKTLLAYPKDCREIKISPTTKVIECAACRTCNVVKSVKVPEGVESIGAGVFMSCANLEVVELPKSLKRIGSFFLGWSPKMKRLVFTGDAPEAIKDKFLGVSKDLVIEVKKGSKGWNGKDSTDLPKRWPLNSSNSCPIRYID